MLVLLAIAPATIAALVLGWLNLKHAHDEAQQHALWLARSAAAVRFDQAAETRRLVATLSAAPSVRNAAARQCRDFLQSVMRSNAGLADVGVIAADGRLSCGAGPRAATEYFGNRTYFRTALQANGPIGVLEDGQADAAPMIVYAAPVHTDSGAVAGVLYAALRLSDLQPPGSGLRLPRGATLTTLTRSGRVLTRLPSKPSLAGKQVATFRQLVGALGARQSITGERTGPDGVRRLYAVYAPGTVLPDGGFYVAVGFPQQQIFAAARQAFAENLSIIGAMALLLLTIGWFGADRLVLRKITVLSDAVRRLAAGNADARTGLGGGDEIAELGQAFDAMADQLGMQRERLEEHAHRVDRLNRIYRVLSGINAAILRLREESALLQEACRIAVEAGGLRTAWIGRVDEATGRIRLVAHAGVARAAVERQAISTDEMLPEGRGTVGPALRSRQPEVCNDVAADQRMAPWRDMLLEHGCRAAATFPLMVDRRVVGNFTLYAGEAGYFDDEEIALYQEVAADTAMGLQYAAYEARHEYLAYHDPTTGLPNRALFRDRIEQAIIGARRKGSFPAVLAVEIPEVQKISDRFGHHVADEALRAIAPRLSEALREGDSLARLEGHAFAIGLAARMKGPDDANVIASRILRLFPLDMEVDGKSFVFSARIGLSVYSISGTDVQTLVRNAELALHALEPGRRIGFYSPELDRTLRRRHDVEQALARADLDRELRVLYQPIVDIDSESVVGAEALVRWNSPALGEVSPGEFIPIAEQVGRVEAIGQWVLRQVLRDMRDWQRAGLRFGTVSVNVAAAQVRQGDFPALVASLLARSGVDTSARPLALELTETTAVESLDVVVEALAKLRKLGLQVYLDDFGTGYSSLMHLQKIPADTLKIDIGFTRRLVEDGASLSLVRGSIMLAHGLGLRAIAEGVERPEQLRILHELGCDEAQGFLLSRPIPPGRFADLVAEEAAA